jgi:hypothetical protein
MEQIKFLEKCVARLKTAVTDGGEEGLVDALEELEDQVLHRSLRFVGMCQLERIP